MTEPIREMKQPLTADEWIPAWMKLLSAGGEYQFRVGFKGLATQVEKHIADLTPLFEDTKKLCAINPSKAERYIAQRNAIVRQKTDKTYNKFCVKYSEGLKK